MSIYIVWVAFTLPKSPVCPGVKAPLYFFFTRASIGCLVCHSVAVLYVSFIPFFFCLLSPPSGLCCCVSARGKCRATSNNGSICISSFVVSSSITSNVLSPDHQPPYSIDKKQYGLIYGVCLCLCAFCVPQTFQRLTCDRFLNVIFAFCVFSFISASLNHDEMQCVCFGGSRYRPRTYCLADSDEESSSAGSSDEDDSSELSSDPAGAEG